MPWTSVLSELDDRFHRNDGDPYWNESTFFSFSAPDEGLMGFVYYYFRPNMHLAVGGPGLVDGSGPNIYDCLYWGWNDCMPMPAGADMYEFQLANRLTVHTVDLMRAYRMTYDSGPCRLDLTWTALEEPCNMRTSGSQLNEGIAEWVVDSDDAPVGHYEQPGRMRGTLSIRGREIAIDSSSVRDRSWGPRPLRRPPRFGYSFAADFGGESFNLIAVGDLPIDGDPVFGTTEWAVAGWYTRGGARGHIVRGVRQCERDRTGRPRREVLDAEDHLGRTLHVEGEITTTLKFPMYGIWLDTWCLTRWTLDGRELWGESHDVMSFEHHRRLGRRFGETGA